MKDPNTRVAVLLERRREALHAIYAIADNDGWQQMELAVDDAFEEAIQSIDDACRMLDRIRAIADGLRKRPNASNQGQP